MVAEFRDRADAMARHAPVSRADRHVGPSRDHRLDVVAKLGNTTVGRVLHSPGVQRSGGTSVQRLDESVARAIEERRGRGRPLDEGVRKQMEQSLGHDLSDVRVHTDGPAHDLNDAVSARAFTTGADVFFKRGSYEPSSAPGRELLAHELTHVVQQRTGASGLAPGEVSHPSDAAEQHASDVSRTVASQGAAPVPTMPSVSAGVARQEEDPEEMEEGVAGSWEPDTVQREATEEDMEQEGP